ncbi:uncharacterized protein TM35_000291710 [Trypanosoma theileri]|uniref:Uncharacterized protein n=1 Tax=Trypanosoma theileri TaxID=67003 RepID=A0A1X0NQ22_9TRYP|nr:uncharacterized protein TM35_000291710 [Trypanosoma theileri]ORC86289.1 hypothetical protein TM35_000291710 [Trypanosoma theileri]
MGDQWVAASILHPGPPTTSISSNGNNISGNTTTTTTGLKRPRDSYLYDRDGKRLKGMKGEAARLMHDHRIFSSEEELHHLEQALAAGQRTATAAAADGGSGGGSKAHGLPALPDMFGVVVSTAVGGTTMDTVNGENVNNGALVPPMHRWSLVQNRQVTVKPFSNTIEKCEVSNPLVKMEMPSLRISGCGNRWVRADAQHVENALTSLLSSQPTQQEGKEEHKEEHKEKQSTAEVNVEEGCGDGVERSYTEECRRKDLPASWITYALSAPAEAGLSVLNAPVTASPFAFFTLTEEEYTTLGLDADIYQPVFVSHAKHNSNAKMMMLPWRFDFTSTCKLITLYERFGNFAVVADRWKYADSNGVAPARDLQKTTTTTTTTTTVTPPVEVMMERYRLVTEAVLRNRLHLLQGLLEGDTVGVEATLSHDSTSASQTSGVKKKQMEERVVTSTHPLCSLLEKHPILAAQRKRQEWLTQRQQKLNQNDDSQLTPITNETNEDVVLTRHRVDILQQWGETALSLACSSYSPSSCNATGVDDGVDGVSSSSLLVQTDNNSEKGKVDVGDADASMLISRPPLPSASPFWYDTILEQVRREQLHEYLISEAKMNVPYFNAVVALRRVDKQATLLLDKLKALTHDGRTSQGEVDPSQAGDMEGKKVMQGKRRIGVKNRKQQNTADAMAEVSYQAVKDEVQCIPFHCERLKLSVQAGWFLPPPVGSTNGKKSSGSGGGGANSNSSAIVNRALSNFSEALLLTLPPSVPRLHLGVEHELEKHLWEDHRALSDDNAEVQQLLSEARVLYTQNVILRRFAGRCGVLEASLKKLASEAAAVEL